jgi:hypothetical protein
MAACATNLSYAIVSLFTIKHLAEYNKVQLQAPLRLDVPDIGHRNNAQVISPLAWGYDQFPLKQCSIARHVLGGSAPPIQ